MQLLAKGTRFLLWESSRKQAAGITERECVAKSEQTMTNYGERDAQLGRLLFVQKGKDYKL
jgi:hypothetical protein